MVLKDMRQKSWAFLLDDDFKESWSYISNFPKYIFSNKHKIYNIERDTIYYYSLNQRILLYNTNGQISKTLKSCLINVFSIYYDYIYSNEYFYKIPTFTHYAISNYNRVISLKNGNILKINKDKNGYLYVDKILNDHNKRCKVSLQYLWRLYKTNGRIYVINPETEVDESQMEYMKEKEYFVNIPNFPGYSVSNYGNVKQNKTKQILSQYKSKGYCRLVLSIDKNSYHVSVHYLVIITFKGKAPSSKHTIDHKDRQRDNNIPLRAKP